jgi:hypothetical protein
MKVLMKTAAALALISLLFGCGGSDSGTSDTTTDSTSSGSSSAVDIDEIGSWIMTTDDDTYFAMTYDGDLYAVGTDDSVYTGTYEYKYSSYYSSEYINVLGYFGAASYDVDLYPGTGSLFYSDIDNLMAVTAYSRTRSQDYLVDTWSNDSDSFSIDDEGNFYMVADTTGCTLDGIITYVDNGVYYISGEASGCIDGNQEGAFNGVGMMPLYVNSGVYRQFDGVIKHSNSTFSSIEFANF